MHSRRAFVGHLTRNAAIVAFAAGTSVCLGGCDVLGELETWIPVGLTAFDQIVTLLNPVAGSALAIAVTTANGLWTAIATAISNYEHSTDPKNTLLQKLIAALDAGAEGLDQVVASLPVSVPAAVLVGVKAGLALLISTLNFFAQKYAGTSPAPAARTARTAKYVVPPAPKAGDFVKAYNALKIPYPSGGFCTIQ